MYCPNCGVPARPGSRFCFRCGKQLPVMEPVEKPAEPEEPAAGPVLEMPPVSLPVEWIVPPEAASLEEAAPESEPTEDIIPIYHEIIRKASVECPENEPVEEPAPEAEPVEVPVPEAEPAEEAAPEAAPVPFCPPVYEPAVYAPKKGRVWPPILCMVILFLIGLAVFILLDRPEPAPEEEPSPFYGAEQSAAQSDPWFSLRGGVLYFDASRYTGGETLQVPMFVDGKMVTGISDRCFQGCTELTSVELPGSITAIGAHAFDGCTSLRGIQIPEGVTTIGSYAFSGCGALEAVSFPSSLEEVGEDIFHGCSYLRYIYYNGTMSRWRGLCSDVVNPFTDVTCIDGRTYQGIFLP